MKSEISLKKTRKVYKIKKLIPGYKIDKKFAGKTLIAVPLQQLKSNSNLIVKYNNETMFIEGEPIHELAFKDRFGRGVYILCYFEWKPKSLQLSFGM